MDTATSIVDPEQVAATLEAAADYIETNGWHQRGNFGPPSRTELLPACLVGAVQRGVIAVTTFRDPYLEVQYAAMEALRVETGWTHLSTWNDHPGREEWEAVELVRTTAKKVRHDIELGAK